MKTRNLIACAVAIVALAGCNKKSETQGTVATNETVTITQANPPPGGNWSDVVNATSAGFMMGNPNAKVKLIEIGALTCPHCREFDETAVPELIEKYVKSGQVSWEFRPYLLNGLDIPANLLAACNGPKSFFPLARALYKDQPIWIGKIQAVPQGQVEQVQNLPPSQQFAELAKLAGLPEWAAARGVAPAKGDQCLRDEKTVDQLVQQSGDITTQYPQFKGTPAFVINGKMFEPAGSGTLWDQLKAALNGAIG